MGQSRSSALPHYSRAALRRRRHLKPWPSGPPRAAMANGLQRKILQCPPWTASFVVLVEDVQQGWPGRRARFAGIQET